MSAKDDGEWMDVEDLEAELARVGHELAEGDTVLVRTGRDAFLEELAYVALGPAVTAEATRIAGASAAPARVVAMVRA